MARSARSSISIAILVGGLSLACGGGGGGGDGQTCAITGCLVAARSGAGCACQQWETISTEIVAPRFVVVGVNYGVAGAGSQAAYGYTSSGADLGAASLMGARWRTQIAIPQGAAQLATLGPSQDGLGQMLVAPVTAQSGWFATGGSGFAETWTSQTDLVSHDHDEIVLWVNPVLTVRTTYDGAKEVSWGALTDPCPWEAMAMTCQASVPLRVLAGQVAGTLAADPYAAGFLASLSEAERAQLLALDAAYGLDAPALAALASDPRFVDMGTVQIGAEPAAPPVAWMPCDAPLSDAGEEPVLGRLDLSPDAPGEHRILLYGVLSDGATCARQSPGLSLRTQTPDCTLTADVLVDRRFGTFLTIPMAAADACTRL
jgi:hypothetical protein